MDRQRAVTVAQLIKLASQLRSEHGENPEYDRGLVELITDAAGESMDNRAVVAQAIGVDPRAAF